MSVIAPEIRVRIVKNTFVLFGGQATLVLSSAITTFALARGLGVARFGEYNAIIAFVGLFLPLASIGLDTVLVREMAQNREQAGRIFGSALLLRLAASLVAVAACIGTSLYLNYPERVLIAVWSFFLVFSGGQLFQAPFSLAIDNRKPIAITMGLAVAGTIVRLLLIVAGVPLAAYLVSDLVI